MGIFDFVFRSHSSANDRICHKIEGIDSVEMDDNDHYARSFKIFMDILKPTYAIPFASNHCHLHKDVFEMNFYINDPYTIKEKIQIMGGFSETEFKIMLPGDLWDSTQGFTVNEANAACFENKAKYLRQYVIDESDKLNKYYEREKTIRITKNIFDKFFQFFDQLPFWIKRRHKNFPFLIELRWDEKKEGYIVYPFRKEITSCSTEENYPTKISMPAIIFRDAIYQNMFHHSGISKRNQYHYNNVKEYKQFHDIMKSLELIEHGFYPLSTKYVGRLAATYIRRWRELFVYANALSQKMILRRKIYNIEEKILLNT